MPCSIYKLDFQEKNSNLDRDLNHGSPENLIRKKDHWHAKLNSME